MVGAKPTGPIDKIHEYPIFNIIWHLQHELVDGIRKLGNAKFPLDGHIGYILLKETFGLFLRKEWKDPREVGECYEIPVTVITET